MTDRSVTRSVLCLLWLAACGGVPTTDGGVEEDAGSPGSDAGTSAMDAGATMSDAGSPLSDAGTPLPDAGTPVTDAGQPTTDAGVSPTDAGTSTHDAGVTTDAGCAACSPDLPGPFTVTRGSVTLPVTSATSSQSVQLTTWVPVGAPVGPVIILHPGFTLSGDLYASYGQHLASRGYVAIVADPPDALLFGPTQKELGQYLQQVIDWVDVQAADGGFVGVADPSRLGLAGHSMGGKISLLVATTDARPRAVFGIDPVDSAGGPLTQPGPDYPSVTPELIGSVHVPIALVGETTNATCSGFGCQACAPAADNFQQYAAHTTSPTVSIEVVGANHMSFIDNPACGLTCSVCSPGTDDPVQTRRLTRRSMTAFFDLELRGDTASRAWLAGALVQPDVADGGLKLVVENGF